MEEMESEVNISLEIERLIQYGLSKKLIEAPDASAARNGILDLLRVNEAYSGAPIETEPDIDLNVILNKLLQHCYDKGILPDSTVVQRDLLSAKIMGHLTPEQSKVIKRFRAAYLASPMEATDYLYGLSMDVNYIYKSRFKKNYSWDNEEPYGRLELVNSFQIREETPEETEKRKQTEKPAYPLCSLCPESIGFSGNLWVESKRNLRSVPLTLANRKFHIQYSRKQYYGERFFVAYDRHEPFETHEKAFEAMLDFVDNYPHCFLIREAELKGLGNSYEGHGHFEGGSHVFPIELAEDAAAYRHELFSGVSARILNWPVSVIRLECDDAEQLTKAAAYIEGFWEKYEAEDFGIIPYTEENGVRTQHNALAAAARKNAHGDFEVDIVLRNNRADETHPGGIFGCPKKHNHIRLNEIGLVSVMGLAVFPSSFDSEMLHIMAYLMAGRRYNKGERADLDRHEDWINVLVDKYGAVENYETARTVLCFEAARKFDKILESCGVFKRTEEGLRGFKDFLEDLGFIEEDGEEF